MDTTKYMFMIQHVFTQVKYIGVSREEYKLHGDTKLTDDVIECTKKSVTQISDRLIFKKHVYVTMKNVISKTYYEINLPPVI